MKYLSVRTLGTETKTATFYGVDGDPRIRVTARVGPFERARAVTTLWVHPGICTAHLINDKIVFNGDTANIEFAGTVPGTTFSCRLDRKPWFDCESVARGGGKYTLKNSYSFQPAWYRATMSVT